MRKPQNKALNLRENITDEYNAVLKELFPDNLGEGSTVLAPLTLMLSREVKIGKRVMIMNNCLMMSAGGITIDDDAMIAATCNSSSITMTLTTESFCSASRFTFAEGHGLEQEALSCRASLSANMP